MSTRASSASSTATRSKQAHLETTTTTPAAGKIKKDTDSQLQKDLYADILRRLQFAFLSPKGQRITQAITASAHGKTACRHDVALAQPRAVVCHFCEEVVMTKTYYHCCQCLDSPASPCGMNICEVCIAGRGCSCTPDRDHILFRKGWLTDTVDFGQLVGLEKPNGSKKWWRRKPAKSPEVGSSDQTTLYESDGDEDDDDEAKSASPKKTVFMGFRNVQRQ